MPSPQEPPDQKRYLNAAATSFAFLKIGTLEVDGGWRDARMLDGQFSGWLCPHVHASQEEAQGCRTDRESLFG